MTEGQPPLQVISRADYQRRRDALVRFGRGAIMADLVALLALGPLAIVLAQASVGFLLLLPVAGVALAFFVDLAIKLRRRALGLTCPVCGTPMVQLLYAAGRGFDTTMSLSGGRCVKCKRPLVEDRVTAGIPIATSFRPAQKTPATPTAFVEARERFDRGTRFAYAVAVSVGVVAMLTAWLASRTLIARGAGLLAVTAPWPVSLGITFTVLMSLGRNWETRARSLGLACAKCGVLLVGGPNGAVSNAVLALGTCPHCSTPLWTHHQAPALP